MTSPNCDICCTEIDDIIHHFTACHGVKQFWLNLEKWWNRTSSCQILITNKHIIFGLYYDNLFFKQINYILLLSKWFIHEQLYQERCPDFFDFLPYLKYKLGQEKQICVMQNDKDFEKSWGVIYDSL